MNGMCKYYRYQTANKQRSVMCMKGVKYDEVSRVLELGREGSSIRLPCTGAEPGTGWGGQVVQKCEYFDDGEQE